MKTREIILILIGEPMGLHQQVDNLLIEYYIFWFEYKGVLDTTSCY